MFSSPGIRRGPLGTALAIAVALLVAACGSSTSSSTGSTSSSTGGTSSAPAASGTSGSGDTTAIVKTAETQLAAAYKGRFTHPPTTPNPAKPGMNVWFISPGQASPNAAATWTAAKEAGEKIGWKMTLFDGKLDPSRWSVGINQAVAAGANGIISMAIDCSQTKSALENAKKAGVKTVSLLGFDCNDADPSAQPLFSAPISLGTRYASWPKAYQEWGSDSAAWSIVQGKGKAKVLNFLTNEYLIMQNLHAGYTSRLKECTTCQAYEAPWSLSEVGAPLSAKVQSLLLKYPDANAVQDEANPQLGFSNGVVAAGKTGSVNVVGGLGLPADIALLKEKKGLNALPAWPLDWWSWAAIDTLNSVFNGKQPDDSGLGWQMIDLTHNLPAGAVWEPAVNFKAMYLKRWGKG
jgi:ribose transport system substrate-binding protein